MEQTDWSKGSWFILTGGYGKYICHTVKSDIELTDLFFERSHVGCDQVFDFLAPMNVQPNPMDPKQMGITKDPYVTPLDVHCSKTFGTVFDLANTHITLISSLNEIDQELYQRLIMLGQSIAASWREQRSPVSLAKGTVLMPPTRQR